MRVIVNGQAREVAAGATVGELLRSLSQAPEGRGVAIALDGEVVPRGAWGATALHEGARVEIVAAVQGG